MRYIIEHYFGKKCWILLGSGIAIVGVVEKSPELGGRHTSNDVFVLKFQTTFDRGTRYIRWEAVDSICEAT